MSSFTQSNLGLVDKIICADEEEFKRLSGAFLKQNYRLIMIISKELYSIKKVSECNDFDDVVSLVDLAVIEVLKAASSAHGYISRGIFWMVVKNKAKALLHEERGTGVSYSTLKRLTREENLDLYDVIHEDDLTATPHAAYIKQKSLEKKLIDSEVRAEFEQKMNILDDIERKAITCRKYSEFDEPVSRRTYSRIRSRARNKLLSIMDYEYADYHSALVE